jgi:hypothetical protein
MANGWPPSTTLYDTRGPDADRAEAFLGTVLVTPRAGWQTRVSPGWTKPYTAVELSVCSRPVRVLPATVAVPPRGMPSWIEFELEPDRAQSCPRIVTPSRQRPARTSTRFVRPLPALLAAMQKGKHGAVWMQAVSPFSGRSCPQRGTSQMVASSSLHVPREMQSWLGGGLPSPPDRGSYRVYDQRTDLTYRSTPAQTYSPGALGSENSTSVR